MFIKVRKHAMGMVRFQQDCVLGGSFQHITVPACLDTWPF